MLRKRLLATGLAIGAAGLAACNHEPAPGPAAAIAPGVGFYYLDEGPAAKLAYGRANSDDVGLMLVCARGSRQVEVTVPSETPAPMLTLAADGVRADLPAAVDPGEGLAIATAHTPLASPALAAFRRSGRIEVAYGRRVRAIAARPGERATIEQFFAACDRRGA